jgi:glycosyltransferase involved in cell wall biosynthesis
MRKMFVVEGVEELRVLFLSIYDPYTIASGPANHLRNLSEALIDLGCEVHVLAVGSKTWNSCRNDVHIHYVRPRFFGSIGEGLMFSLSSIGMTNEICKNYGIDVLHGQSPSSFGYALLSRAKRPFVVTFHGTSFGEIFSYSTVPIQNINLTLARDAMLIQPSWAVLTNIEYHRADKVIAVSKAMAQEAEGYYRIPRDKIVVIPNGVCLPSLSKVAMEDQNASHIVLFVGRLIWRKGIRFLIEALPQILAEYPDAELQIVGNGEQKSILEERIKKFGIENSVRFLGRVSPERLVSLYHEADVVVQPSLYEPCSLAILEAMSFGKPVVATRVGGIPDLITNGIEGLLVEPENSLQLATAITTIFSDESLKRRLADNARKRVEREFTWKAIAEKTLKLYASLFNAR